jgi:hypothetical protein
VASWTTPSELRAQVLRRWERGQILAARLSGEPLFPLRLRLSRPTQRALLDRYDEVRRWIRALEDGATAGYRLEWEEIRHRQLGANRVPCAAVLDSQDAALAFIGKTSEARRFATLCDDTLGRFPSLAEWLRDGPMIALAHHQEWAAVLAVLAWFEAHPRSGRYLRQIDAPGVHTKFIEARRGLLSGLLDRILPEEAVDRTAVGGSQFEARYGLRPKPALVRMRVLDARLAVGGLLDVCAPLDQVAALPLRPAHVFVTENDVNALAFPEVEGGVLLFGGGYGLERLASIPWMASAPVTYWGDLDTHGFAILDRLRGAIPNVRSFLMDRETLLSHRALWTQEPADKRLLTPLHRLTPDERALFDDLRGDRLGERVRLEQERIGFRAVEDALRRESTSEARHSSGMTG